MKKNALKKILRQKVSEISSQAWSDEEFVKLPRRFNETVDGEVLQFQIYPLEYTEKYYNISVEVSNRSLWRGIFPLTYNFIYNKI